MLKHVYILGAGFSYPLGGPLFTEILTSACDPLIQDQMREIKHERSHTIFALGGTLESLNRWI